jgi:cytochrome c oxidase cbb3-type subunit III
MAWRSLLIVAIVMTIAAVNMIAWQKRHARTTPAANATMSNTISVPNLYPGGAPPANLPDPRAKTHEDVTAYDVAEGKRLYSWMNCNTCHANGGGGIGPALMDEKWIYGSEPRNIFETILEGRPNGMPSFRGKIPDAQVWQLVAYVRSMAALTPKSVRSSRNDDIAAKPAENMESKKSVQPYKEKTQ